MNERIGPYEIQRELGRGGMGVVYLARDTRLDRLVAIKSLPEHLNDDPDRLARFEREAKILASLSHPNVGGIHGLERANGQQYLVLEYVDGETLADRLSRGPIPVDDALTLAGQIAEALEAAHEKGVVHRDLKPGNVMVTPSGVAKVLDFGLARTAEGSASSTGAMALTNSPTMTTPGRGHSPTIPGVIMGSAGYMSPEQARGKPVDKRSDIFSFGCVLYEMLTGAQPFSGETVTDSLGAILHKAANLDLLPPGAPRGVRSLLEKCLVKDRHKRLHDIADARIELERIANGEGWTEVGSPQEAARARSLPMLIAIALVGAGLMLGAGWMLAVGLSGRDGNMGPIFASIDPAPGWAIAAEGDVAGPAAISPNGRMVVFAGRDADGERTLCLRAIDLAEPESLRGTENAVFPFWSADSKSIGFFADGKLRHIDLTTRAVRTLCDAPGARGGAWLASGDIIFTPAFQSELFRIPAQGGEPTPITTIDRNRFSSHRWPSAIAGTDRFTYLAVNHDPSKREETVIYIASLDGTLNKELIRTPYGAQIIGDRLLFLRENSLQVVPVNVAAGALTGEPVPLIDHVWGDPTTWHGGFSASASGALIYHQSPAKEPASPTTGAGAARPAAQAGLGEAVRATLVNRTGGPAALIVDGMLQNSLSISPDGLHAAISGRWPSDTSAASYDIWVFTMFGPGTDVAKRQFEPAPAGTQPRRFTFMPGDEVMPRWSPDGKWIAFGKVFGAQGRGLYIKPLDGGSDRLLFGVSAEETRELFPSGWTPDGRYILCNRGPYIGSAEDSDIVAVPFDGGAPIDVLVSPNADCSGGVVSNDGKWLAFEMASSGNLEVYIAPFAPGWEADRAAGREVPSPDLRYRISIAGGWQPQWGSGGDTLYYASTSNSMIAVTWSTDGPRFAFDAGQALFDFPFTPSADYDVFANEQLFLVNTDLAPREVKLRLVLNWPSLLKQK